MIFFGGAVRERTRRPTSEGWGVVTPSPHLNSGRARGGGFKNHFGQIVCVWMWTRCVHMFVCLHVCCVPLADLCDEEGQPADGSTITRGCRNDKARKCMLCSKSMWGFVQSWSARSTAPNVSHPWQYTLGFRTTSHLTFIVTPKNFWDWFGGLGDARGCFTNIYKN